MCDAGRKSSVAGLSCFGPSRITAAMITAVWAALFIPAGIDSVCRGAFLFRALRRIRHVPHMGAHVAHEARMRHMGACACDAWTHATHGQT